MSRSTPYVPPVGDFRTDLDFSFDAARAAFDAGYRAAFGPSVRIELNDDLALQRQGIDVYLHLGEGCTLPDGKSLPSGTVLRVDEKARRPPLVKSRPWNDVLIEEFSDWDRKIPGWLAPEKISDLIAYGGPDPSEGGWRLLLLWTPALREKARTNRERWLSLYGRKLAKNRHFHTSNIPVPLNELEGCIAGEFHLQQKI